MGYFEGSRSVRRVLNGESGGEPLGGIEVESELSFGVKSKHDIIIISTCGEHAWCCLLFIIITNNPMRNKNYSTSNADT